MIKLKNFRHTIFNLICVIFFILLFIFIALSKGNKPSEVIGFTNMWFTYLFIILIYVIIGLVFDSIINFVEKKYRNIIVVILKTLFFGSVLFYTLYILLAIILFSLSRGI